MAYIDVISLTRAKDYLRVSHNDDDTEITQMINGACTYIEKRTNHIFFARDRTFIGACQVKVYDYPINSIITTPAPFAYKQPLFTVYPDVKEITLNVGYTNPLDVPSDLVQAVLQMLKVWYYESEKQVNTTLIPEAVKEVIEINKRFV